MYDYLEETKKLIFKILPCDAIQIESTDSQAESYKQNNWLWRVGWWLWEISSGGSRLYLGCLTQSFYVQLAGSVLSHLRSHCKGILPLFRLWFTQKEDQESPQ